MTVLARKTSDSANPRRLSRKKPLRFKPRLPGAMWAGVMEERPLGGGEDPASDSSEDERPNRNTGEPGGWEGGR